ncbi:hypothetical protein ABT008_02605 [Micromonospora sp. NPDC002389]|uniref:hypothetical protein n=1 Tax=Micromonospora sp. NPDC002389 TaxID=3154272 RepID=UPI00332E355D
MKQSKGRRGTTPDRPQQGTLPPSPPRRPPAAEQPAAPPACRRAARRAARLPPSPPSRAAHLVAERTPYGPIVRRCW